MSEKDPLDPSSTSDAYDAMSPAWRKIETLLGGTDSMRAAGEVYLPRHTEETSDGYENRLNAAVLLNMTEQTLDSLSGKPFSEPVKLGDDIPDSIAENVLPDVDLQGNRLDVFAYQLFREGLSKAFCHVLIDMPRPKPREDGSARTLEDDRKENVRPYWVLIKPECEIFAQADIVDGVEVLQHVRIMETYTVRDGFIEVCKSRIRVLEPGRVQLWEPDPMRKLKGGAPAWNKIEEWETGLDYIPYVTFYADRQGFRYGKPPLLDLADLNIAHWQSGADQRHVLTVARFPILACSGAAAEDSDPVVVGPNKVLYNSDPQGKFYYIEHTGAAIEAGRNDLQDLQEQMAGYGAQFLNKKSGDPTATARALDSAEQTSDLAAMALNFEDAVAQILDITADWMKLSSNEGGGTIEVVKDYDVVETDQPGLAALSAARTSRDISRITYLEGLRLRGILPEDFDAEEDAELLEDEAGTALGMSRLDLDPTQLDPNNPDAVPEKGSGNPGEDANVDPNKVKQGKPSKAVKKATTKKAGAAKKGGNPK